MRRWAKKLIGYQQDVKVARALKPQAISFEAVPKVTFAPTRSAIVLTIDCPRPDPASSLPSLGKTDQYAFPLVLRNARPGIVDNQTHLHWA